jgi:hypothetical protein
MNLRNVLFIGCGGSAGRIVSLIKDRLSKEEKSHNLHYLVYDLEPRHITDYENLDSEEEYCFFGGNNPREFVSGVLKKGVTSPGYKNLNKYFPIDQQHFLDLLPDRKVERGAGRKRMVGRLLAYVNQAEIKKAYDLKFKELQKSRESVNPNIVVISSCCGGTGSSIFYDILNLAAGKTINLFPVVIGPSRLVEENQRILSELGEKIRMNAFAFFEELSVYNNYPEYNFSFFSTESTRLNLPYIYFFDNYLNESDVIATETYEFETYVAACLAHIFSDSAVKPDEWEMDKEIKQGFASTLENVRDDFLNQPHKVFSQVIDSHEEKANFIGFSYFETPDNDFYLAEILKTLIGEDSLPAENTLDVTDLAKAIDPKIRNRESLRAQVDMQNEGAMFQKFVTPYIDSVSHVLNLDPEKVLRPETIKNYLTNISGDLKTKSGNQSNSSQSFNPNNPNKGIVRRWWERLLQRRLSRNPQSINNNFQQPPSQQSPPPQLSEPDNKPDNKAEDESGGLF